MTASGTTKVSGATLRAAAGLRSTWITALGSLSLTRPGGPAVYGKALTVTGKAEGVKGAVLSQRIDGVWQQLPGSDREGEAARAHELPALRRQARRPGAEGSGGPARPPRSGRRDRVRHRQAARLRARRWSSSSISGAAAGRRCWRRRPTTAAASRRRARARASTARGPRRFRASPRVFPDSSRCHDPARPRLLVAAALLRSVRGRGPATPSARPRSPTYRVCSARSGQVREPRAAARGRRRACDGATPVGVCPARPMWSGSARAAALVLGPERPAEAVAPDGQPRVRLLGRGVRRRRSRRCAWP